jgi:hypothetical protein
LKTIISCQRPFKAALQEAIQTKVIANPIFFYYMQLSLVAAILKLADLDIGFW